MITETTFDKAIEFRIDEAKPIFWIQDIRVEGTEVVIEAEMTYLGVVTDIEFKRPVVEVLYFDAYMDEDYAAMEHEANRWLDKKAESFQKEVSNPLSYEFKKLIEKWNK